MVTYAGNQYNIPGYQDTGYAQGVGTLQSFFVALASSINVGGGTFALTADANFGSSYGLIATYFTSVASHPATAGVLRLAVGDAIAWRDSGNSVNLPAIGSGLYSGSSALYISGFSGKSSCQFSDNVNSTLAIVHPVSGHVQLIATSGSAVEIQGTVNNDSAAAGFIGEFVRAANQAVNAAASTVWGNISSINLSAGDWDVDGLAECILNGATITGKTGICLSIYSGNTTTDLVEGDNGIFGATITTGALIFNGNINAWRVTLTGPTTIYLKGYCTYSSGTPYFNGRVSARRRR